MTEAEARARIITFANANEVPVLASSDIDVLMSMSRRVDKYEIQPGDPNWTPSWNIWYGVAQAWLLKSGRLTDRYLFMSGGKMLSRNQFYEHCMEQYRTYMRKAGITGIRLYPQDEVTGVVPNNWNPG